jgi:transcriptional regulator with XRE-family HTH domain
MYDSRFNGEKLRELRKKNKLSRDQLADVFYVSKLTIHNWENNLKIPHFDTIVQMAEFFGVSLDEFVK